MICLKLYKPLEFSKGISLDFILCCCGNQNQNDCLLLKKQKVYCLRVSTTERFYTQIFLKVRHTIIQAILSRKSMKKLQLPMKKYSVSVRLLTVKYNSHTDFRTSRAQFSRKGCQYRKEESGNKIL